jgi:cation:H+ antiporter
VGNIFGSNLFNLAVLALEDVLYRKGPLLASVSELHALPALSAISCSLVAIIGLNYRMTTKRFAAGTDSVIILAIYFFTSYLLYAWK